MIRARASSLARLALVLVCSLGAAARAADPDPVVIVLSWDGTRHDYPARVQTKPGAHGARRCARARDSLRCSLEHVPEPRVARDGTYWIATGSSRTPSPTPRQTLRLRERRELDRGRAAVDRRGAPERARRGLLLGRVRVRVEGKRGDVPPSAVRPGIGEGAKVDQILEWLDLPAEPRPGLVMSWWHGWTASGTRRGQRARRSRASCSRRTPSSSGFRRPRRARRVGLHDGDRRE